MTLTTEDGKPCEGIDQGPFEPIAVIGLGALMPDAHDIDAFWQNILDAKVSIKTLPEGRWPGPIDHFWKEGGPGAHTEGFTYAKIGALVSDAEFDWRRWRQPPGTLPQIDPCQLWAVTVSADAIEHAGYDGDAKDIDHANRGCFRQCPGRREQKPVEFTRVVRSYRCGGQGSRLAGGKLGCVFRRHVGGCTSRRRGHHAR